MQQAVEHGHAHLHPRRAVEARDVLRLRDQAVGGDRSRRWPRPAARRCPARSPRAGDRRRGARRRPWSARRRRPRPSCPGRPRRAARGRARATTRGSRSRPAASRPGAHSSSKMRQRRARLLVRRLAVAAVDLDLGAHQVGVGLGQRIGLARAPSARRPARSASAFRPLRASTMPMLAIIVRRSSGESALSLLDSSLIESIAFCGVSSPWRTRLSIRSSRSPDAARARAPQANARAERPGPGARRRARITTPPRRAPARAGLRARARSSSARRARRARAGSAARRGLRAPTSRAAR